MSRTLRACLLLLVLLACTLLPFAPGRYDALAVPLSMIAKGLGLGSLILVPVGAVWFLHSLRHRTGDLRAARIRHRYMQAALAILACIGLLAGLLAGTQWSLSLGILLALLWLSVLWRAARSSRARIASARGPDRATPLLCILLPGVYLLLWITLADPAARFAGDRAIHNSAPLIADIERFRSARRQYPPSPHS